jgi:hypothetical protein
MVESWIRWWNGLVYSWFGADGLVLFSAHPLLFSLGAIAAAALLAVLLLAWALWRYRRLRRRVGLTLALLATPQGRRCLRWAREIRRGGARLRHSVRRELSDRGERRELLGLLERFTRSELEIVLEQARALIARSDEQGEGRLREALEGQTRRWSMLGEGSEREALQEAIANTRHRLARTSQANEECRRHCRGLAEAAEAVSALEMELTGLRLARTRALPEFHAQLHRVTERLGFLKSAHRELEP